MDKKRLSKTFFRERKIGKIMLYIELFYALLLFCSAMFSFSLFIHLILGQFIIIGAYFLSGWIYIFYLKVKGKLLDGGTAGTRGSFKQKNANFWSRFDSKFFYDSAQLVTVILGTIIFSWSFIYTYIEFFLDMRKMSPANTLIGYLSFAFGLTIFLNVVGVLMGKQYFVRNCAITEIILAFVLFLIYPLHWINLLLGILVAAISLFLYVKNKL